MTQKLQRKKNPISRQGPLVVVVMDGIGLSSNPVGNAVKAAHKPVLERLLETCPHTRLRAHGTAVGLPSDQDMGNSEVGHNAIGAGRVFHQGARLVNEAIASGMLWKGKTWIKLIRNCKEKNGTLHFIGLFSDGNVHSHIDHLKAMIQRAKSEGIGQVRIHILLDGRDVGETSALDYVIPFEEFLQSLNDSNFNALIASGGGRMRVTMDRYEADWKIVERGWKAHVLGQGEMYSSAENAIRTIRKKEPGITDQFLPSFVIEKDGKPAGPIKSGDSVIFYNFRGDRAIEISRAFEEEYFNAFDRGSKPDIEYAGMMEYDGDCKIPKQFLVSPPAIKRTMSELLSEAGVTQLACSETQKYGHVTYFWNGNWSGEFNKSTETFVEIPSDQIPFEQRPWMKSAEITDCVIKEIQTGRHRFVRLNYANGDMVGHTGVYQAAVLAVESVDLALGRLLVIIEKLGGIAIVTADHGNSDEMFELNKDGKAVLDEMGNCKPKTAHTLNPVPFILFDPQFRDEYQLAKIENPGLSNIAATCLELLGFEPPGDYDPSLLKWK